MRFQTIHMSAKIPGQAHVAALHTGPTLPTGLRCGEAARACRLVGKPIPALPCRSGWWCGRAGRGQIMVSSPSLAEGYWRDEHRTAAAFRSDRIFATADMGFLCDGYLIERAVEVIPSVRRGCGKIQRHRCHALMRAGSFEPLATIRLAGR